MTMRFLRFFFCLPFLFAATVFAATENLDEVLARKSRQTTASWGYAYLENSSSYYRWQPETLCYSDVTTGAEVWKMSNTPALGNWCHDDIGVMPWSADGNRLAYVSPGRDTGAFDRGGFNLWMLVNTDGSLLRPIINGPSRVSTHEPYFHWSPALRDVYYAFGRYRAGNTAVSTNVLYKGIVSDTDVSRSALITFPTTHGSELFLNKTISADGKKIIGMPWDESWWYPATVYPDGSAGLDDSDGYTVDRDMPNTWGDTPASYSSLHDQYYAGDGAWMFILPSGSHAWWRIKVLGSAADGGAAYSFTAPNIFGEAWPENTVNAWGGTSDPFGSSYWSHFIPDRWSRYALFSNGDANPLGPGVWDITNHAYSVSTFGGGAQHNDWHAYSDWCLSSRGPGTDPNYLGDRLYTQKFNSAGSQNTVCYTHTLYNNGGTYAGSDYEYNSLPRPAQSPDGTKAAFHSTFLDAKVGTYDNKPDIYWAVAYYPYPPEITQASTSAGTVSVRFDWRLDQASPRGYTTRKWPDESSGIPPAPREVKQFRLWRSPNGVTWTSLSTVNHEIFTRFDFANGGFKAGQQTYWEISDTPGDGTWYYAVTSVEWSGLESRALSNVWKVVLTGGAITNGGGAGEQSAAYPASPGGKTSFYTKLPTGTTATYAHQQAPASAAGQYTIAWNKVNDVMIRYYNIYARDGFTPTVDQKCRIASVPASAYSGATCSWIDCFGNPDGSTQYRVTSVDYQGNESGTISPPTNLRIKSIQ